MKIHAIALAIISAGLTIAALVTDEKVDLPPVPKYMIDVSGKDDKNLQITYQKVYVFYKEHEDSGVASLFTNGIAMLVIFGVLLALVLIGLVIRRSRSDASGEKTDA